MAVAQIGPLTTVMESLATAVGAGMLLTAFGTGAVGSIAGWSRPRLEAAVVTVSYCGGIGAVGVVFIDLLVGYSLMK